METEQNQSDQLQSLYEFERAFKTILSNSEDTDKLKEILEKIEETRRDLMTKLLPKYVYINLRPVFGSVAFTVPSLDVEIPENPSYELGNEGMVITLKNNGKYQRSVGGYKGLASRDWDVRTEIESVSVFGENYLGEDLLNRRSKLLQNFFNQVLGGEEKAQEMTARWEQAGIRQGNYLYRAISLSDYAQLQRIGTLCFSHLDPSANFESEQMYQNTQSQVRNYVAKTDEGYAGKILRWQIEHPLLYRTAGVAVPRVIPMFSHFLPTIEISDDKGQSFNVFKRDGEVTTN